MVFYAALRLPLRARFVGSPPSSHLRKDEMREPQPRLGSSTTIFVSGFLSCFFATPFFFFFFVWGFFVFLAA